MSIVHNDEDLQRCGNEDECFFCGKQLMCPAVHWMGSECKNIVLHPACLLDLFVRMARDLHEIKAEGSGYPFRT